MAKALLPDELLSLIEAHLPIHTPSLKEGRPHIDDRAALTGDSVRAQDWNPLGISSG